MKLGILGAGNMGGAIACGYAAWLAGCDAEGEPCTGKDGGSVVLYDPDEEKTKALACFHAVRVAESEAELISDSDVIILAIKPQMFDEVIPRIAEIAHVGSADADKIFVSIAAGISLDWLSRVIGENAKIVRVMPNTPAMVGEGMAALARSSSVTDGEFAGVKKVFDTVGLTAEVSESEIDAVTGISGSSPAYAYMYMQALIESGKRAGLDEKTARIFAAQSTIGAARMVLDHEDVSVEQLRINVCSPGGTTIEAVNVLEKEAFMDTIKRAVYACVEKSKRMKK